MRGRIRRSRLGAVVPMAALLMGGLIDPAGAGGLSPTPDQDSGARPQCGGGACPRIKGYVAAGPDVSAGDGRPAPFGPPALLMKGVGAAGQAAADAINRGFFLLQASHDDLR